MNWADRDYAIGRGIAAIRHKSHCDLQPLVRAVVEHNLPSLLIQATGSTFPNVSSGQLSSLPWPSIEEFEQRAIAHILGTLDDKIELNRQQNETLGAMARILFKAWFVDFEPVRAKLEGRWKRSQSLPSLPAHLYDHFPDRLVESPLGEIPEGWAYEQLSKFIEILDSRRVPLSSKERAERPGIYPYHGATGVMDSVDDYLFDGIHVLLGEDGSVVRENGRPFMLIPSEVAHQNEMMPPIATE